MPISMSYPGVYVKEDTALSMSISSGSTAVPVFIFNPFVEAVGTKTEDFKFKPTDGLIRIESWLDYLGKFEEWIGKKDNAYIEELIDEAIKQKKDQSKNEANKQADQDLNDLENETNNLRELQLLINALELVTANWPAQYDSLGYYHLRSYFDNGGGPCYLYLYSNVGDLAKILLEKDLHHGESTDYVLGENVFNGLSDFISSLSDASLICLCGDPTVNKKIFSAVSGVLSQSTSHSAPLFCLQGGGSPVKKNYEVGEPNQSAVYYPYLISSYKYEFKTEQELLFRLIKKFEILNKFNTPIEKKTAYDQSEKVEASKSTKSYVKEDGDFDIELKEENVVLSPVAAIAGAYCRNDSQRGVWKAPANITLNGIIGLCDSDGNEVVITDAINADLIAEGINPIRYFPGKGFTVWGARTLDTSTGSKWKYIPVRRLFNIAERDIKEAMAKAVFEPNTSLTWETIRSAVDAYLHNLWKQGALFGDTAEQAYFVKIGLGSTMDEQDIKDGKMIIKVGMAPVSPAEFIILEFSQKQI